MSRGTGMFKVLAITVGGVFLLAVAAIIIPCLSRSDAAANESSAAGTTRTLATAEIQYESTYGSYTDIKSLSGPIQCSKSSKAQACLIDFNVANSSMTNPKSGYYFTAQPGPTSGTFFVTALPVKSPNRSFCAVEDAIVRSDDHGSGATNYASCKSLPPIGG